MKNIYIIRPKGFNIGNDVIYVALSHFIRKTFGESCNFITVPATSKYEVHKKSGLTAETIHEINQFGHGLIVGGGNLYENGELEINKTALKALDVPMMIFSVSRGKVYNKNLELVDRTDVMTDDNIRAINEKASISISRDLATKKYLDSIGCNRNIVGGCPTLFIGEMPQHNVPIAQHDITDALISIREPGVMNIPVQHKYQIKELIEKIILMLKSKGYSNLKLLCHDRRDIPFAASFRDVEYLYTEDVFEYLTYLKNTKCNVTFRLHSFLPSLSYGIPSIKISYDQRAFSMLETIGMEDWNVNLMDEKVIEAVENRLNDLNKLSDLRHRLKDTLWKERKNTLENSLLTFKDKVYGKK